MKSKIILSLTVLLLFGCVRESVQTEEDGLKTFDCFTVTVEESPMTKVHMEDSGVVKWDVGDCIGVYSDTQAPVPYYRGEDGKFYGEKVSGTTFYAFYPYDPVTNFPNIEYDEQEPTRLKCHGLDVFYGGKNLPMVAKSANNCLSFRQICGLLHIRLRGNEKILDVEIIGNRNEAITGRDGFIDFSADYPIYQLESGESTGSGMYLFVDKELTDNEVADIFFIMPVMSFDKGLTLKVFVEGYSFSIEKRTTNEVAIERGKIISLSEVDLDDEVERQNQLFKQERDALVALYNALDGDHWVNNTNWCSDRPVGEWYGINAPYGFVTDISLAENNLQGVLPPQIGELSYLESLNINNESGLIGSIPLEIGNLKRLRVLVLFRTNISGTIPKEIGKLGELEMLDIAISHLSGEIPEEIGNCHSLVTLILSYNELSGSIPESIGRLSNLKTLYLDCNNLTGQIPSSLGDITGLGAAYLLNNYLSGPVPVNFMMLDLWEYMWPWQIFQYDCRRDGNGLDPDSFILRGPRFSVTTCDGEEINDGIYDENELTILLEIRGSNIGELDYLKLQELYHNYKKKGLEIIGYGSDLSNEELKSLTKLYNLPGKFFHYDGAGEYAGKHTGGDGNVYFLSNTDGPAVNIVDRKRNIVFEPYYTDFFTDSDTLSRFISHYLGAPDPIDQGGDNPDENPYTSTDYSSDGKVRLLQQATVGDGINVVLLGDAFTDRLIDDGTYDSVMENVADAFFSEEPYKSLRNLFNVYVVYAVSENDIYGGRTAVDTKLSDGTEMRGDNGKVLEYVQKAVSEEKIGECLSVVILNKARHSGTCYLYEPTSVGDYGGGFAIAYCTLGLNDEDFVGQILHEAAGHGFAKLDDEYVSEMTTAPESFVINKKEMEAYGWWKNVDYTSDPTQVKWARFIADSRYTEFQAGVYEGGGGYSSGVYRSTMNSIMRYNEGGFNVPSREAIYYRIHKLTYGSNWQYNYEDFVTWDLAHRTPAATSARSARPNFVEKEFEPLAPPVVINKDWREVVREGKNKR